MHLTLRIAHGELDVTRNTFGLFGRHRLERGRAGIHLACGVSARPLRRDIRLEEILTDGVEAWERRLQLPYAAELRTRRWHKDSR